MDQLENDHAPQTLQAAYWSVQPTWAKLYAICVGLPAWAFLVAGSFAADFGDIAMNVAAGLFAVAVLIQMAFVFRAYWRMDI